MSRIGRGKILLPSEAMWDIFGGLIEGKIDRHEAFEKNENFCGIDNICRCDGCIGGCSYSEEGPFEDICLHYDDNGKCDNNIAIKNRKKVCLRCGHCCKNNEFFIIDKPNIGLKDENMILKKKGDRCKHLLGSKPGSYSCMLYNEAYFNNMPCIDSEKGFNSDFDCICYTGKEVITHLLIENINKYMSVLCNNFEGECIEKIFISLISNLISVLSTDKIRRVYKNKKCQIKNVK